MKERIFESAFNSYNTINKAPMEGATGRIYEVIDDSEKKYALKLLKKERINTRSLKRFQNELYFCLRNRHENIIEIQDFGYIEDGGKKCPFYIMPLYNNSLRELLNQKISHQEVLKIFSKILDGIEAAHLLNVWHRDLKPENILCDTDGENLVITDFGCAHFTEELLITQIETRPNERLANFQYAAPEQREKNSKVDHRVDIWALGLLLNEMFTNKVIAGTGYLTVASVAPDYAYLDQLIEKMIKQNPDERPSSIDEIKQELIVRKNKFIKQQELDQQKRRVITKHKVKDPLVLNPIKLVVGDIGYSNGRLIFYLNQKPNHEWIDEFRRPESYISIPDYWKPDKFHFNGDKIEILADIKNAQNILNMIKDYINIANERYKVGKEKKAEEYEKSEREYLEKQLEEAEITNNLSRDLKW